MIPAVNAPISLVTKDLLKIVIFAQYVPRLFRIYPLYKEVTRTSGLFTETAWAGAAFNLFLYMLASHVSFSFSTSLFRANTIKLERYPESFMSGPWSFLVLVCHRKKGQMLAKGMSCEWL